MSKLAVRSKEILSVVSGLEKKHKLITYASLMFLTVSTYFLRSENENVKIEYATLKERNASLQQNVLIFNRNYEEFPLPIWQKVKRGDKFIMNYLNPEYVKQFGHIFKYNVYDVIGKNNFELFPKSIAQSYYEHDITVSITGGALESIEHSLDKDGNPIKLLVLKWRDIKNEKDTLVYGMVKEFIKEKK